MIVVLLLALRRRQPVSPRYIKKAFRLEEGFHLYYPAYKCQAASPFEKIILVHLVCLEFLFIFSFVRGFTPVIAGAKVKTKNLMGKIIFHPAKLTFIRMPVNRTYYFKYAYATTAGSGYWKKYQKKHFFEKDRHSSFLT